MSVNRSQGFPMMAHAADGHGSSGGAASTNPPTMTAEEVERRRQILSILDQGDRDIAAGQGNDWSEVKGRMRDRISARSR